MKPPSLPALPHGRRLLSWLLLVAAIAAVIWAVVRYVSPAPPRACSSRTILSAHSTAAPSAASRSATRVLPVPIPPVRPTSKPFSRITREVYGIGTTRFPGASVRKTQPAHGSGSGSPDSTPIKRTSVRPVIS